MHGISEASIVSTWTAISVSNPISHVHGHLEGGKQPKESWDLQKQQKHSCCQLDQVMAMSSSKYILYTVCPP